MLSLMRHRVTIQEKKANPAGLSAPSWIDIATVWAEIKPASGRESFVDGGIEHSVTHKVMIRDDGRFNFDKGLRILFKGRPLRIHYATTPLEVRGNFVILSATEGVGT